MKKKTNLKARKPETELPNGPDSWSQQKIIFCNHDGYFHGDVIVTPIAVTVIAAYTVSPSLLSRSNIESAQWQISDAHGGYWNPTRGRFVLPREAVSRLRPA